jgi:hypothetical protein
VCVGGGVGRPSEAWRHAHAHRATQKLTLRALTPPPGVWARQSVLGGLINPHVVLPAVRPVKHEPPRVQEARGVVRHVPACYGVDVASNRRALGLVWHWRRGWPL